MLYVMLAYLMLFAALFNAVCIILIFAIDFYKYLLFSYFVLGYWHIVYLEYHFALCTVLLICWFS